MSEALYAADQALVYAAPDYLPIVVLAAGYGETAATPDNYPTVDVTWRFTDRPGSFTTNIGYSRDWHHDMDAALRVAVFNMQSIYASLGGWPAATPLEDYPVDVPPPGQVVIGGEPVPE